MDSCVTPLESPNNSPQAIDRLLESEVQLLLPPEPAPQRHLACIYMGTDETKLVYVGQTQDAPERRWKEHRLIGSGPFKKGATYVRKKVTDFFSSR